MSMDKTIARINELARKKKSVGLTEDEKKEQQELRRRYLNAVRSSVKDQLNTIEWTD